MSADAPLPKLVCAVCGRPPHGDFPTRTDPAPAVVKECLTGEADVNERVREAYEASTPDSVRGVPCPSYADFLAELAARALRIVNTDAGNPISAKDDAAGDEDLLTREYRICCRDLASVSYDLRQQLAARDSLIETLIEATECAYYADTADEHMRAINLQKTAIAAIAKYRTW